MGNVQYHNINSSLTFDHHTLHVHWLSYNILPQFDVIASIAFQNLQSRSQSKTPRSKFREFSSICLYLDGLARFLPNVLISTNSSRTCISRSTHGTMVYHLPLTTRSYDSQSILLIKDRLVRENRYLSLPLLETLQHGACLRSCRSISYQVSMHHGVCERLPSIEIRNWSPVKTTPRRLERLPGSRTATCDSAKLGTSVVQDCASLQTLAEWEGDSKGSDFGHNI